MKKIVTGSIRNSMILCFSVLILAALMIFNLISLRYTRETVLSNSIDYTSRLIGQVNSDIDSYISYMENISELVSRSADIRNFLQNGEEGDLNTPEYQRILTQFETVVETREDLSNIGVIALDGRSIINGGWDSLNPYVELEKVDWYREAAEGKKVLTNSHVQYVIRDNYKWVVTLSRPILGKDGRTEGVFFIDLNYKILSGLCEKNNLGANSYVFILDEAGNVIYHPKQQLLFRGLTTELTKEVLACEDTYFLSGKEKTGKLYTISRSEETGWSVVGVVSTSELMQKNDLTEKLYMAMTLFLLLLGVWMAVLVAGAITRPLRVLQASMKEVEKGNFEKASIEEYPDNELGHLSRSFNTMTARIRQLMEQNAYEQEQKRKSDMKALRSQIKPHFLYNTLDSIIWMAEGGKNKEVVIMTSSLAKLLRQSISNEDEMIPLFRELDYAKSYLTIQKMRYKDKLEFSVESDPGLKQERVLNLLLQPMVENAIYHGIKTKEGKGFIRISAQRDGSDIVFIVEDNGVGMDQETLAHIFDKSREKEKEKSNGIGVYNVHMRIRLYYGEGYGLTFESSPGEGTRVYIRVKMLSEEDPTLKEKSGMPKEQESQKEKAEMPEEQESQGKEAERTKEQKSQKEKTESRERQKNWERREENG